MLPAWITCSPRWSPSTAYSFKKLYPTEAGPGQFAVTVPATIPALALFTAPLYGARWAADRVAGRALAAVDARADEHLRRDQAHQSRRGGGAARVGRLHRHRTPGRRSRPPFAARWPPTSSVGAAGQPLTLIAIGLPAAGSLAYALADRAARARLRRGGRRSGAGLRDGARRPGARDRACSRPAYLLRAFGDSPARPGPTWLTWLTPIGWSEQVRPFAAERWWVLARAGGGRAGHGRGVMGAGRPPRPRRRPAAGPPRTTAGETATAQSARPGLALAGRSLLGWALGFAAFGLASGLRPQAWARCSAAASSCAMDRPAGGRAR